LSFAPQNSKLNNNYCSAKCFLLHLKQLVFKIGPDKFESLSARRKPK
jgi:hypothetical protein